MPDERRAYEQSDPRMPVETCCKCDVATGRASRGEDSFYWDACGEGPFCEECDDEHMCKKKQED